MTYIFLVRPHDQALHDTELSFCRRAIPIRAPRAYTPWKLSRGVWGPWPVTVANYTSPELIRAARELLRKERYDLVHVDGIHLAGCEIALRPELDSIPVFYDWHNIESELMENYSRQTISLVKRYYAALTARRLFAAEARILQTASGHVVCSERERAILQRREPGARVAVIENGVDKPAFDAAMKSSDPARERIVFVGSFNYHANIEGVLWFAQSIWPAIRQRFPETKLTLVGSDPSPAVLALRDQPGIEVTGTVPDVRPYYGGAFAAVVPLLSGGGTRLKILEAMAAGVPVISTPKGAEGLLVSAGQNLLIADAAPQWVAALDRLRNQKERAQIVAAARECVTAYDWENLGRKLFDTYRRWIGESIQ